MTGATPSGGLDDTAGPIFWIEERIRNMDTDQFGHVNNAAIAGYCEAGRMSLFADDTVSKATAGLNVVVVKLLMEFVKELFYPGHVRIGTGVTKIGTTSFSTRQAIHGPSGLVATSEAVCVLIDAASRKPAPVPDGFRLILLPQDG